MLGNIDKKLRNALIQFFIWVLLLSFVAIYLQSNPAERQSILWWPAILFQNVKVMFYSIFSDKWDFLQEKYSLERAYSELILTAEWMSCMTWVLPELNSEYNKLQGMSLNEYLENRDYFRINLSNYSDKINEGC